MFSSSLKNFTWISCTSQLQFCRERYDHSKNFAQNSQKLMEIRRNFKEGNKLLLFEAKSLILLGGLENTIFSITCMTLFYTMFKLFSSIYIPHNLIHSIIHLRVSNPSPSLNISWFILYSTHNSSIFHRNGSLQIQTKEDWRFHNSTLVLFFCFFHF